MQKFRSIHWDGAENDYDQGSLHVVDMARRAAYPFTGLLVE